MRRQKNTEPITIPNTTVLFVEELGTEEFDDEDSGKEIEAETARDFALPPARRAFDSAVRELLLSEESAPEIMEA